MGLYKVEVSTTIYVKADNDEDAPKVAEAIFKRHLNGLDHKSEAFEVEDMDNHSAT